MRNFSAPITAHVEITEACDERCRHCYNFCRDESFKPKHISWENLDATIAELIKNKVMHVIITGGEPMLAVDRGVYLAEKCIKSGMSISLNSNLVSATPGKIQRYKEAGVDHCLTTLFSYNPKVHNFMAGASTWPRVVNGINLALDAGIRISVNTIVTKHNKDDVLETGRFLKALGVGKFISNRCIPSQANIGSLQDEFLVDPEMARKMFHDLKQVRALGLPVQTCRMVPECFFDDPDGDDLEFTHRGCHASTQLLINVNGDSKTCPHDTVDYGNIHEIGIAGVWKNAKAWRTGEYIPDECKECSRFESCGGGCRMVALYYTGSLKGHDNLRKGNPVPLKPNQMINIREEDTYYIVRELGAKVKYVDKYR